MSGRGKDRMVQLTLVNGGDIHVKPSKVVSIAQRSDAVVEIQIDRGPSYLVTGKASSVREALGFDEREAA